MSDTPQIAFPPVVAEIAKRAKIKGINLARCNCELVEVLPPGQQNLDVRLQLRGGAEVHKTAPRTIICSFGADITAVGPDGKPPMVATLTCDYGALYEFDDEAFFRATQKQDWELFAAYNTSFQLWPHLRELMQSMAARMGLPPIILPAFRPLEMIGTPSQWKKRNAES